MSLHLRPFHEEDRPVLVDIRNRNFPDEPRTVERMAYSDRTWNAERYTRVRVVAERNGRIVGWGQVSHTPWRFHPRKYELRLEVDPDLQRQGIGGAVHDWLLTELRARDALLVRADAQESRAAAVDFLAHRGYREVQRAWVSNLSVADFDPTPFSGAEERVSRQGIHVTTLAAERARDPEAARPVYELSIRCEFDEPTLDPATPIPYEEFLLRELDVPAAIPEAVFLAKDGERYVGFSSLQREDAMPDTLDTGFTGVHPDYRGRGIAMALKLRAIQYAQERGYRRIRTGNHSLNAPMLRINVALGFQKEPARITFERAIAAG